jgi:HD-GYP domain-containing protein (c-di-GMP phosphodiesterase class II)/ABC-type amino acid transport substrate-binding protein
MSKLFRNMGTTIQLTVVTVIITATTLTAVLAIGLQYYFGQSMARQAATDLYSTASSGITEKLTSIGRINGNVIDLLANNGVLGDAVNPLARLQVFTELLQKNPLYYGIYLGSGDGSFFEVINLDTTDVVRQALRTLPSDRWLIITMRAGEQGSERHYQYLDANLETRLSRSEPADYDVRNRPWYIKAMASSEIERSEPYLFAQLGAPGRTLSKRIPGSDTVVAIDMTLTSISEFLSEQELATHSDVYLYSGDGQVIATSLKNYSAKPTMPVPQLLLTETEKQFVQSLPTLTVSNELNWPPFDYTQAGQPRGYSVDVVNLIAQMTGLKLKFSNGNAWPELLQQFKRGEIDVLQSVIGTQGNKDWGLPGSSYAELPYALVTRENSGLLRDLSQLNGKSLAIPSGWSIIPIVRSSFPGVDIIEADSTLHALKLVLAGEASAALDNEVIFRYISRHYFLTGLQFHTDVGMGEEALPNKLHIMVPAGQPQLRKLIDKAIAAIGEEQFRHLEDKWLIFNPENSVAFSNAVPDDSLVKIAANPDLQGQLLETRIDGETYLAYAASAGEMKNPLYVGILTPLDTVVAPFQRKAKLSIGITAIFLLLLLPFSWAFANPIVRPIRQLAAENDKVQRREYDKVKRVSSRVKELDELSVSMINMVESIQAYELAQRALMDSFIELIAQTIDDKSAYTGGHCERVPELALMLAKQASHSELKAFRDFRLETDDEWREYRIAAWLHDCGKITTPEHIVDKGSKLEVIYNRIHEVRMRFEVLWRDAEIEYWQRLTETPGDQMRLAEQLKQKQRLLREDFDFVAECNVGGEFLSEDKQARIRDLAQTTWQRQFDDRIGLSPAEAQRTPPNESSLPTTERLLSNKPEHIIERTQSTDYPPELGISMDVPEHLYNQGEVYNLSISRGTLTNEDRFKINEHMISTIKILESLPFPDNLKNVPRYASTHHETMKGSGYPRKLTGEQLSIPERILAVADVFEALTASDRPYKKSKPVSVAVDILHKMVLDNHLDQDCFELFVRDKVYLQYAQQYLSPEQIDEVDVTKYVMNE